MAILVTGACGFVGFHLCSRLLNMGHVVTGIDNLNTYYDPRLKASRLAILTQSDHFQFVRLDIADSEALLRLFADHRYVVVIHLAAQAGVRYSLTNPLAYVDANLSGFVNILEGCRQIGVQHLLFASSSSVYGANSKVPFSIADPVDHPTSLYGATKRANELLAYSYSHLHGLPTTGMRFFSVYGPWGRPDMAYYKFAQAIIDGQPVEVYGDGEMRRDYTYIDDVIEAVCRLIHLVPTSSEANDAVSAPYRLLNIGNTDPVSVNSLIHTLEHTLGKHARLISCPKQAGEVAVTFADVQELVDLTGFRPCTSIEDGLARFVDWLRDYRDTVTPRGIGQASGLGR